MDVLTTAAWRQLGHNSVRSKVTDYVSSSRYLDTRPLGWRWPGVEDNTKQDLLLAGGGGGGIIEAPPSTCVGAYGPPQKCLHFMTY